MMSSVDTLRAQAKAARPAARRLAASSTATRNGALEALAAALEKRQGEVLAANRKDLQAAKKGGLD